jgi:hypothetical protein
MKNVGKASAIGAIILISLGIMLYVYPSEYPENEFRWCPGLYCYVSGCNLPYEWFHEEVGTCCFRVWDSSVPGWVYCCGAEGCHLRD